METDNVRAIPFMEVPEVDVIRQMLIKNYPLRVLEWGAGGSTLYFARMFPQIKWWSVEDNPEWYEWVNKQKPNNVVLMLLDAPDYYRLKPDVVGKFKIILVDGRHRVHCLDNARDLLEPGGKVLLHDCGRVRYKPASKFYATLTMLVPPKTTGKTIDRRGLLMFTDPFPRKEKHHVR